MAGEQVDLEERALVQQQLDPLARGQLAPVVLALGRQLPRAVDGGRAGRLQPIDVVEHRRYAAPVPSDRRRRAAPTARPRWRRARRSWGRGDRASMATHLWTGSTPTSPPPHRGDDRMRVTVRRRDADSLVPDAIGPAPDELGGESSHTAIWARRFSKSRLSAPGTPFETLRAQIGTGRVGRRQHTPTSRRNAAVESPTWAVSRTRCPGLTQTISSASAFPGTRRLGRDRGVRARVAGIRGIAVALDRCCRWASRTAPPLRRRTAVDPRRGRESSDRQRGDNTLKASQRARCRSAVTSPRSIDGSIAACGTSSTSVTISRPARRTTRMHSLRVTTASHDFSRSGSRNRLRFSISRSHTT